MTKLSQTYLFLLKPQGSISRWINSIFTAIGGIGCILTYFLLEYDVCAQGKCDSLFITSLWANNPFMYLILGICQIFVGIFLAKEKKIPQIYSLSIFISCSGISFSFGLLFFAILRELKTLS